MPQEITFARFLVNAQSLTEENLDRIYGEIIPGSFDPPGNTVRWELKKEDGRFIFRNSKGEGTYGHWPTMEKAVEKAIDYGMKVFVADRPNYANPEE